MSDWDSGSPSDFDCLIIGIWVSSVRSLHCSYLFAMLETSTFSVPRTGLSRFLLYLLLVQISARNCQIAAVQCCMAVLPSYKEPKGLRVWSTLIATDCLSRKGQSGNPETNPVSRDCRARRGNLEGICIYIRVYPPPMNEVTDRARNP